MENYKSGDLVIVDWEDIVSNDDWLPFDKAREHGIKRTKSVGWLLSADKEKINLCSTLADDGESGQLITFPAGCLKKIKLIKRGSK